MKIKKEPSTTLTCIEVRGINSGIPEKASTSETLRMQSTVLHIRFVEDKHFKMLQMSCPV